MACDVIGYNTMLGTGWSTYAAQATSGTGTISGTTLTTSSGSWAVGMVLKGEDSSGNPIAQQTTITGGSGSTWTISPGGQTFTTGTIYGLSPGTGITQAMLIGDVFANKWYNDPDFVGLATAAIPPIQCTGGLNACLGNEFDFAGAKGWFAIPYESNFAAAGTPAYGFGNYQLVANNAGTSPYAGLTVSPCLPGQLSFYLCGIYTQAATLSAPVTGTVASNVLLYPNGSSLSTTNDGTNTVPIGFSNTSSSAGTITLRLR
jgi:hypothetical protein